MFLSPSPVAQAGPCRQAPPPGQGAVGPQPGPRGLCAPEKGQVPGGASALSLGPTFPPVPVFHSWAFKVPQCHPRACSPCSRPGCLSSRPTGHPKAPPRSVPRVSSNWKPLARPLSKSLFEALGALISTTVEKWVKAGLSRNAKLSKAKQETNVCSAPGFLPRLRVQREVRRVHAQPGTERRLGVLGGADPRPRAVRPSPSGCRRRREAALRPGSALKEGSAGCGPGCQERRQLQGPLSIASAHGLQPLTLFLGLLASKVSSSPLVGAERGFRPAQPLSLRIPAPETAGLPCSVAICSLSFQRLPMTFNIKDTDLWEESLSSQRDLQPPNWHIPFSGRGLSGILGARA